MLSDGDRFDYDCVRLFAGVELGLWVRSCAMKLMIAPLNFIAAHFA
jgi:hypothetical protein